MKPILFNTEMVRAILEDRKTVTRRVVKPQPADTDDCQHEMQTYDQMLPQFYKGDYSCVCRKCGYGTKPSGESIFQPPCRPSDILYVRETWAPFYETMHSVPVIGYRYYSETDEEIKERLPEYLNWFWPGRWFPSIHMPREAARIFLRVMDVRVERLQDITEEEAVKEGFEAIPCDHPGGYPCTDCMNTGYLEPAMLGFVETWDSTIKPTDRALYGWEANPWVWVIEFERIEVEKI